MYIDSEETCLPYVEYDEWIGDTQLQRELDTTPAAIGDDHIAFVRERA
jgi:hypothetical protein